MTMAIQDDAWSGPIGQGYTDRNIYSADRLDSLYLQWFGSTRYQLNRRFLQDVPLGTRILEVGCNVGMQLRHLKRMGYTDLHGIDLQQYAIDQMCAEGVTAEVGSATDLPYNDRSFDLVFTSGLLIHIPWWKLPLATGQRSWPWTSAR